MAKDTITMTKALNDMKDYLGLEDISNVYLSMDNMFNTYIEFVSNNIDVDSSSKFTVPDKTAKVIYRLTLTIQGVVEE